MKTKQVYKYELYLILQKIDGEGSSPNHLSLIQRRLNTAGYKVVVKVR